MYNKKIVRAHALLVGLTLTGSAHAFLFGGPKPPKIYHCGEPIQMACTGSDAFNIYCTVTHTGKRGGGSFDVFRYDKNGVGMHQYYGFISLNAGETRGAGLTVLDPEQVGHVVVCSMRPTKELEKLLVPVELKKK